jgi:hypothetical protein
LGPTTLKEVVSTVLLGRRLGETIATEHTLAKGHEWHREFENQKKTFLDPELAGKETVAHGGWEQEQKG